MAEKSKVFCCTKYALIACNAFGLMLGIFVVLFGVSYPEENFPGGYSGRTTAIISAVLIFFTLIGYCGAHHQKAYFLIIYSFIIILFLASNVVTFYLIPERSYFDLSSKPFWIIAVILLLVLCFACLFAYQVRNLRIRENRANFNNINLPGGTSQTLLIKSQLPIPPSVTSAPTASPSTTTYLSMPRLVPVSMANYVPTSVAS